MNMHKPEAVIYDLGNTLVSVDFDGLVEKLTGRTTKGFQPKDLMGIEIMVRWQTGRLTPHDFHAEVCVISGRNMPYDAFVESWCDIFGTIPGAEQLMLEVAKVARIGLLSDTDPLHWPFELRNHPWLNMIPNPTVSYETGFLKPSPEAYLAAARNVGLPPEKCLFVDDLERNIAGARAVGMQAVLFTGVDDLKAHLVETGLLDRC